MPTNVWPASRVTMREQEFQFRAKLIHPPQPLNSNMPPSQVFHPAPHVSTFTRSGQQQQQQRQLLNFNNQQSRSLSARSRANSLPVVPSVDYSSTNSNVQYIVTETTTNTRQQKLPRLTSRNEQLDKYVKSPGVATVQQSISNLNVIEEEEPHASIDIEDDHIGGVPKTYTRKEGVQFIRGDPHSERLALFVANMVFMIFWHGSKEFTDIMHPEWPKSPSNNSQHQHPDEK